ncbi:hypothetical protein CXF85_18045 [Colwellia sp. 75C3]|uniref:hypothetical protein n=1 Tax=Colwellia sp. 75C3 TaxID=888425 RepID=UPI000C338833|nr:hypothetical protein [Colwellia sp. 75C3]PKG81376.1 hypothetical protein CXF85_18045 [Colwellia sp. 75C3]
MDNTNLDRRHSSPSKSALWNQLTIPQQFASASLNNFGYDLAYIRDSNINPMAILLCDSKVAVIDADGDINTDPSITIR